MIAIGCFFPIVLPPLAALLGYWLFGPSGGLWGAAGGFVLGIVTAGVTAWAFEPLKSD